MKRVLIITYDFPPQGGTGTIRVTKFVKYLVDLGWQPVVVCSDTMWNYDESLMHDIPEGLEVYRVAWPKWVTRWIGRTGSVSGEAPATRNRLSLQDKLKGALRRIYRRLLIPEPAVVWVSAARRVCAGILKNQPCDVVLTTSPPHSVHLVGSWLRARFDVPWVADFRDAWTASNPPLQRSAPVGFQIHRRIERRMLMRCDRAIMVTQPVIQYSIDVFGPWLAEKLTLITNGFDPEDFAHRSCSLDDRRFVITYLGTILGPQVDNAFPEGLRLALERSPVAREHVLVRFVGQLDPTFRARLEGLETNVDVMGYVAHDTALDMMCSAHVLLLVLPESEVAHTASPNKFFEYMAARRPILAVVPAGAISGIVEGERIGLVAAPDNAGAIAEALLRLFDTVCANPMGYAPSAELLARFDRQELARSLARVLDEVVQG